MSFTLPFLLLDPFVSPDLQPFHRPLLKRKVEQNPTYKIVVVNINLIVTANKAFVVFKTFKYGRKLN